MTVCLKFMFCQTWNFRSDFNAKIFQTSHSVIRGAIPPFQITIFLYPPFSVEKCHPPSLGFQGILNTIMNQDKRYIKVCIKIYVYELYVYELYVYELYVYELYVYELTWTKPLKHTVDVTKYFSLTKSFFPKDLKLVLNFCISSRWMLNHHQKEISNQLLSNNLIIEPILVNAWSISINVLVNTDVSGNLDRSLQNLKRFFKYL